MLDSSLRFAASGLLQCVRNDESVSAACSTWSEAGGTLARPSRSLCEGLPAPSRGRLKVPQCFQSAWTCVFRVRTLRATVSRNLDPEKGSTEDHT